MFVGFLDIDLGVSYSLLERIIFSCVMFCCDSVNYSLIGCTGFKVHCLYVVLGGFDFFGSLWGSVFVKLSLCFGIFWIVLPF